MFSQEYIFSKSREINNLKYSNEKIKYNIDNALRYFSNEFESNKNKDIHIVGHSGFMKNFFKHYLGNPKLLNSTGYSNINDINKNKFKEKNIADQNSWTLEFNMNNGKTSRKLLFIRHAFSVANYHKGKGAKIDQTNEKDASLSLYGILSALRLSIEIKNFRTKILPILRNQNNLEKQKFRDMYKIINGDTIYVSCLIRTWMTALCLFLPILSDESSIRLKLKIADCIKEEGNTLDNKPEDIKTQISKICVFITFLKNLDNFENNTNKKIGLNLFDKELIITIDIGEIILNYKTVKVNFKIRSQPSNNNIFIYYNKDNETTEFMYTINDCSKNYELWYKCILGNNYEKLHRLSKYFSSINNIIPRFQNKHTKLGSIIETQSGTINYGNYSFNEIKLARGIMKPTKDEINKVLTRWFEPFSIKTSFIKKYFSSSHHKKDYLSMLRKNNLAITNSENLTNTNNNKAVLGGKKTTKKPVKKTTTKKPIKKTSTKKPTTKKPVTKKSVTKKTVKKTIKKK